MFRLLTLLYNLYCEKLSSVYLHNILIVKRDIKFAFVTIRGSKNFRITLFPELMIKDLHVIGINIATCATFNFFYVIFVLHANFLSLYEQTFLSNITRGGET